MDLNQLCPAVPHRFWWLLQGGTGRGGARPPFCGAGRTSLIPTHVWGINVQGSYCPKTKEYPFGSKLVLALNAPENIQALEMCFECLRTRRSKKSHFSVNQFSGSLIRGRGHVAGREQFTKQKSQNISAYLTYLPTYLTWPTYNCETNDA